MPNFKYISFKMAVLQGSERIQKTPCGMGLEQKISVEYIFIGSYATYFIFTWVL